MLNSLDSIRGVVGGCYGNEQEPNPAAAVGLLGACGMSPNGKEMVMLPPQASSVVRTKDKTTHTNETRKSKNKDGAIGA
jgi:hypothetical protein